MFPTGSFKLPRLRLDLEYSIHRQGDKNWYCVQDPLTGQFYRLGAREYTLACRFSDSLPPETLLESLATDPVWQEFQRSRAVSMDEIVQLASWLQRTGLCQTGAAGRATSTYRKWVFNPLAMRFPLLPGQYVERICRSFSPLLGRSTCIAIVVMYCIAIVVAVANWKLVTEASSRLFVADSQLWWLAAWLILKLAHEIGHATVALRVGSHVRAAGLNINFFAPIPYVDVSDLWTINNRWHRIACSAGGILTELAISSLAIFIAVFSESESVQYLCCAVAVTGTVTTLAFNANPLMRFDGYYILADLLNIPNLWTNSQNAFSSLMARIINPWHGSAQALPSMAYACYGGVSLIYRTIMSLTLAATAILVWKSIGVVLVIWSAYAIYINPWLNSIRKQRAMEALQPGGKGTRWRQRAWVALALGCLSVALTSIPSPVQPSSPGVVSYFEPTQINAESQGTLEQVSVRVGQSIQAGQMLALLRDSDAELELQIKRLEAQAVRESMRTQQSRGNLAELQAAQARLESLETQLKQLESRVQRLSIVAPCDGVVVQLSVDHSLGQKITVGTPICMIARSMELEAVVSASQRDLNAFHLAEGQQVAVQVVGGSRGEGRIDKVELRGQSYLNDPLLAGCYNGPIPVELDNSAKSQGRQWRLMAPRFDVHVRLPESAAFVPGQIVWARVPGQPTSIGGVVVQWLQAKWTSLKYQFES